MSRPTAKMTKNIWLEAPMESAVTLDRQMHPDHQEQYYTQEHMPTQQYQETYYNDLDDKRQMQDPTYLPQAQPHVGVPVSPKSQLSFGSIGDFKSSKRCQYGCIPTNRKSRNICLLITFGLLAIIATVGFIFFPRIPDMQVLNLNLSDGLKSFKVLGLENGPTKDFTIQIDMWMTVAVQNTNKYHMKVDDIGLKAYIMANITEINKGAGAAAVVPGTTPKRVFTQSDSQVQIGTGDHESLMFPSGQNITFKMNFTVLYKPDPRVKELKDDTLFNEIVQSCGMASGAPRNMQIHYDALAPVKMLQPIGYTPKFAGDLKINCPFPPEQIAQLIGMLKGTGSVAAAVDTSGATASKAAGTATSRVIS